MTVERVFAELEGWFAQHAPRAKEVLLPPATTDDIAGLEKTVGVSLPPELRSLLQLHNGQDPHAFVSTIDGCRLCSCQAAGKAWSTLGELLDAGDLDQPAESRDGKVKPVWWNKRWIPFADAGGDLLCFDLDPGPSGAVAQVIRFHHDESWREQLALTLEAFLSDYLRRLQAGRYKLARTGGIQPQ
jgi:cell wall assembly regulator SMI1